MIFQKVAFFNLHTRLFYISDHVEIIRYQVCGTVRNYDLCIGALDFCPTVRLTGVIYMLQAFDG